MDDRLLTLDEARDYIAARGINVARNTLRTWQYQNRGPRITLLDDGHISRYRTSDLDDWLSADVRAQKGLGHDPHQ